MQFFAGERRAVDTVFADSAAGHDNQVAGIDGFLKTLDIADLFRQCADSAAVNQRLAQITVFKIFPAESVRNPALVAAVNHPFVDTVAQAAGMQQAFRHIFVIAERRTEAIPPDVNQQFSPLPCTHRVAVDADNTGHRAAVGIKRGRTVMGFNLVNQVQTVIESNDPGIIVEYRYQPVNLFADLVSAFLDERLIAGNDLFSFAGFEVFVVDLGIENLVFAVL